MGKLYGNPEQIKSYVARHCGSKKRFATRTAAESERLRMLKNYGEVINIYYCEICWHWHLGHTKDNKGSSEVNNDN